MTGYSRPLPRVSVVIPTLNEASMIAGCLMSLVGLGADEVVVVDAASPDGTAEIARGLGVRVIESCRGRGVQQNLGAMATTGEVLLFLHADCRPAPSAILKLKQFVASNPRVPGGCLRMRVDTNGLAFRMIDATAHVRAGVLGVPYGDQAIFARRRAFEAVGGFPETKLMDDVLFSLKLRRLGRVALLRPEVRVSDRRWRACGIARQTARNWLLTAMAAAGVSPDRLARFYPAVR